MVWRVRRKKGRSPHRALKACFKADDRERARFAQEMQLLQDCAGDHVLALHEAHEEWAVHVDGVEPFAYYVAEICLGPLTDFGFGHADVRDRLEYFEQACRAVGDLHGRENPVLHRDLKPANFLIADEPRRVVLADFGIAREEVQAAAQTETGEVVGTPRWRAPEVGLFAESGSPASDVYSMGRILEWLLTGQLPVALKPAPVPRGVDLSDAACEHFDQVIARASAMAPEARFATVKDLLDALPALWLDIKEVVVPTADAPDMTPTEVHSVATGFARARDGIALRGLTRDLRRALPDQVMEWRARWDSEARKTRFAGGNDELVGAAHELVRVAMPRITLDMVGAQASEALVVDNGRFVSDVLNIEGWQRGGFTVLAEAPRAIVYVYSYLCGAAMMEVEDLPSAIQLAQTPVPSTGSRSTKPLWRRGDVTGWPETLAGNCNVAWAYLLGLYDSLPVLREFFALRRDWETALASYNLLLTLMELGTDAKHLVSLHAVDRFDVPPMYATMGADVRAEAVRRLIESPSAMDTVVVATGANRGDLAAAWAAWVRGTQSLAEKLTQHRLWGDEIDLGNLAVA